MSMEYVTRLYQETKEEISHLESAKHMICESLMQLEDLCAKTQEHITTNADRQAEARRSCLALEMTSVNMLTEKIESLYVTHEDLISINVGGVVHTTSRQVLSRERASVLNYVANGPSTPMMGPTPVILRDSNGNAFFDRDGALFEHIVNYLRTGSLPTEG
eukprot:PhM_4_TR18484/c0_g1_i1/m.65503